jgi:hypothetical protein
LCWTTIANIDQLPEGGLSDRPTPVTRRLLVRFRTPEPLPPPSRLDDGGWPMLIALDRAPHPSINV